MGAVPLLGFESVPPISKRKARFLAWSATRKQQNITINTAQTLVKRLWTKGFLQGYNSHAETIVFIDKQRRRE